MQLFCRLECVLLTAVGPNQSITQISAHPLKSPAKLGVCILARFFLGSKSMAFIRPLGKFRAIVINNNNNS